MQSDYVAVGKAYHEELIAAVMTKLLAILATGLSIFSIVFSGREKIERRNLRPACCLYLLVFFEKRRASCFTNSDLKDFLEGNGTKSIEFIGVDGNGCVKASVLAAIKENYQVSVGLSAVGVANQRKFQKTLHKWHSAGVSVEGELS